MALVKAAAHAPDLVLTPFVLFLVLSFVSNKQYGDTIISGLRTAIIKAVSIEDTRKNNIWLRTVQTKLPDLGDLLSLVITQAKKSGGWDLIMQGVLDLGLALVSTTSSIINTKSQQRRINYMGAKLLVKLAKKQTQCARIIVNSLSDKILTTTSSSSILFTEALRVFLADNTVAVLFMNNGGRSLSGINESPICLDLLENIVKMPYNISRRCLNAIMPVVKINKSMQDVLVKTLRKLLFSPSTEARQAGTAGVLMLLKIFKVSSSGSTSLLSQSTGSLSQMVVDSQRGNRTTNQALCLELLGVLKRCFIQQCQVKMVFYQDIHEVMLKNPSLTEDILQLGYSHLLTLWGPEGSSRNRWQIEPGKTIKEVNGVYTVDEPVGWFLSFMQFALSRCQQIDDESSDIMVKVSRFFKELVSKYSDCEPGELGFSETDNFDKKTKEGERNLLCVEQVKSLLESLIEYVFTHGAETERSQADLLIKLFQVHAGIDSVVTASLQRLKAKKGEKSKGKTKDNSTQDTSADAAKTTTTYSPPSYSITWKCVSLILNALFCDDIPLHQTSLQVLRDSQEFVNFILEATSQKLTQLTSFLTVNGDEGRESDNVFGHLQSILASLFHHSFTSSRRVCSGEEVKKCTAIFQTCLQMMLQHFPRRLLKIVSCLQPNPEDEDHTSDSALVETIRRIVTKTDTYMGRLEDPDEEDVPQKVAICLDITDTLIQEISDESSLDTPKHLVKELNSSTSTDNIVMKPLQSLVFHTILKTKLKSDYGLDMSKKMHFLTGDLDTTVRVEQIDKCPGITDDNKYQIMPILFNYLDEHFTQAEITLSRLKGLVDFVDSDQRIIDTETHLCFLLAKQVNALSELVKTSVPIGPVSEGITKLLMKQYTTTGVLTKYLIKRSKTSKNVVSRTKFNQLIKCMNWQLTRNVHNFITYVDNARNDKERDEIKKRLAKHKQIDSEVAKAKVIRESKVTGNLIWKIHLLDTDLMKLGKRVKDEKLFDKNLMQNRDFKLRLENLKPASGLFGDEDDEDDEDDDEEEQEEVRESPVHHSTAIMGDITNSGEQPARKKMRRSLVSK